MKLVAGVDSSTQSTKVLLVQADDGSVVGEASAPHPDGTECHPDRWWEALSAAGRDLLERADAVGVAAQQHGMVTLDDAGAVVRPAMLWNDVKSAPQAAALVTEFGGPAEWAARTGSVPTMSFTVTKLRWLAEREPEHAARVHRVAAAARLADLAAGRGRPAGRWRRLGRAGHRPGGRVGNRVLLPRRRAPGCPTTPTRALGHPVALPRVAAPAEVVGRTSLGRGDLRRDRRQHGRGARHGAARRRRRGLHRHLGHRVRGDLGGRRPTRAAWCAGSPTRPAGSCRSPCTLNAARVLDVTARMLGVDRGRAVRPGAEGASRGGRTGAAPLPGRRADTEPARRQRGAARAHHVQRDAGEPGAGGGRGGAVLARRRVDCLRPCGITPGRIVLTGGAARSEAVRTIAPAVFGLPVAVPEAAEYVALGAARQAAWALSGADEPPSWPDRPSVTHEAFATPGVREQYGALRDDAAAWQEP